MTSVRFVLPILVLASSLSAGCAYSAAFNRSPYVEQAALRAYLSERGPRRPDEITFIRQVPDRPFVILGTLDAPVTEWTAHYTTDDLMKAMQEKASEIGADAILEFRTRHNPTVHTVGTVSTYYGYYVVRTNPVPFKGLHAWGEAILFVPEHRKLSLEPR